MRSALLPAAACALVLTASSCEKALEQAPRKLDACALLTKDEIQEVQGAPVQSTQPNERFGNSVRVSQCYFAADPTNRSISLAVSQNDPAGKKRNALREVWNQTLAGASKEREPEERHGEEIAEATKKIDGIGDEAFWVSTPVGGILFVRKNDAFIRLSLGGPDEEQIRIEKSKKLARKAVERF